MISAIILAAGQSKRMGQPKMLLPWGNLTVIEHVIVTFLAAGIQDILLVTGGSHERVQEVTKQYPVRNIHNSEYVTGEMLSSLQVGLNNMRETTQAVLIGLGDQPQTQAGSIRLISEAYRSSNSLLIVPSFQMKRGHPWLVARPLWQELLELEPPETPRDFLNAHASQIQYVNVDTPTVLADLDTPEDYQNSRP